jgi:hypothetical protein
VKREETFVIAAEQGDCPVLRTAAVFRSSSSGCMETGINNSSAQVAGCDATGDRRARADHPPLKLNCRRRCRACYFIRLLHRTLGNVHVLYYYNYLFLPPTAVVYTLGRLDHGKSL